jgi:broad specificity phosphatase PhoE
MRRSIDTARLITEAGGIDIAIRQDARLNERCLGELQGRRERHIAEYAAGDLHYAPLGGEPYVEVTRRCLDFLYDLVVTASELAEPVDVAIVGHTGPMRIIRGIVESIRSPVDVLAHNFQNLVSNNFTIHRLALPPFIVDALHHST